VRELDITTEEAGAGVVVVALAGEIDLYTCPEFKQELLHVIADGATLVVVDLTKTTFIDPSIVKIFEVTGLNRIFSVYGSRDEALAQTPS
jgi:anti-sigma B factor antagonist